MRIVLTGGPGAGKTAVLELVRQQFDPAVLVLPEAASMLFRGGFPRDRDDDAQRAAQLAIHAVQRQLEYYGATRKGVSSVLCDRGTIDGLAYWPGDPREYWCAIASTKERELARYDAVIHMHTPRFGYNHDNAYRTETAEEAAAVDARINLVWQDHPRRFEVEALPVFFDKARRVLAIIDELLALPRASLR